MSECDIYQTLTRDQLFPVIENTCTSKIRLWWGFFFFCETDLHCLIYLPQRAKKLLAMANSDNACKNHRLAFPI